MWCDETENLEQERLFFASVRPDFGSQKRKTPLERVIATLRLFPWYHIVAIVVCVVLAVCTS